MKKNINIMIIEDHPEYREIVEMAISRQDDMTLTEQFGTAERALEHLEPENGHEKPNVILLDLNLPGMAGLEALEPLKKLARRARIIVLTQSDHEEDVLNAIMLGASGYLLKSSTVQQLIEGIRNVMKGGASLDARIAKYVMDSLKVRLPPEELDNMLSPREMEILQLMAKGMVKKQIAKKLGIGVTTVVSHVSNIYDKLHASNAPSAIAKGYKLGILQVGE
jgi:two-component system nitrate/nitrite response regulator NarL